MQYCSQPEGLSGRPAGVKTGQPAVLQCLQPPPIPSPSRASHPVIIDKKQRPFQAGRLGAADEAVSIAAGLTAFLPVRVRLGPGVGCRWRYGPDSVLRGQTESELDTPVAPSSNLPIPGLSLPGGLWNGFPGASKTQQHSTALNTTPRHPGPRYTQWSPIAPSAGRGTQRHTTAPPQHLRSTQWHSAARHPAAGNNTPAVCPVRPVGATYRSYRPGVTCHSRELRLCPGALGDRPLACQSHWSSRRLSPQPSVTGLGKTGRTVTPYTGYVSRPPAYLISETLIAPQTGSGACDGAGRVGTGRVGTGRNGTGRDRTGRDGTAYADVRTGVSHVDFLISNANGETQ